MGGIRGWDALRLCRDEAPGRVRTGRQACCAALRRGRLHRRCRALFFVVESLAVRWPSDSGHEAPQGARQVRDSCSALLLRVAMACRRPGGPSPREGGERPAACGAPISRSEMCLLFSRNRVCAGGLLLLFPLVPCFFLSLFCSSIPLTLVFTLTLAGISRPWDRRTLWLQGLTGGRALTASALPAPMGE